MNDEHDDSWEDDAWDEADEDPAPLPCPECGADVYADAESCPECGYWITDADRAAAWRSDSASGVVLNIGWWIIGLAAASLFAVWLL